MGTGPEPVKPRLRGVLHQWAFAASLVTGSVLCAVAPSGRARLASAVYSVSVTLLFGTSALYHRITWRPAARAVMKRLDHSMIFVLIAGTYTPFALLALRGETRVVVLSVVWGGAVIGIGARMLWLAAPRWAIIPLYIGLGWVAVFVFPQLLRHGGVAPLVLLLVGGLFYTLGALAYASRKPNPSPTVFGYHEVFHTATLIAFACHYIAVFLAVFATAVSA